MTKNKEFTHLEELISDSKIDHAIEELEAGLSRYKSSGIIQKQRYSATIELERICLELEKLRSNLNRIKEQSTIWEALE